MPSNSPTRTMRCANCKSTEFVQQQIVTVRTPVDVSRKGQTIVAVATPEPQVVTNQRDIQILCANCSKPLPGVKTATGVTTRLKHAVDWEKALLNMHFFLYPEEYPLERRREHDAWHDDMVCFEWSSDTIEDVAGMLVRALKEHPAVPNEYDQAARQAAADRARQSREDRT